MDPVPTTADLLREAMAVSTAGDSETALALLAQASALAPHAGAPHFLRAAELASLGRFDAAEEAFSIAVLLAPQLRTARFQLGLLQFSSGRLGQALLTWQPLLDLTEDDPLRRFVFGFTALAEDDVDAALRHFFAGIELNRDNAALNGDIRLVIERLQALRSPPAAAATVQDEGRHVLLSNYQQSVATAA